MSSSVLKESESADPRSESSKDMLLKLHAVMLEAVRVGCSVASKVQSASRQSSGRVAKQDSSPVSIGDFSVQACVSHILQRSFPDIKLLAEEDDEGFSRLPSEIKQKIVEAVGDAIPELKGDEAKVASLIGRGSFGKDPSDKPPCFVLDPIDGTKGFLRGEQYAICLGYLSASGEPLVSVMGCPNMPSAFFDDTGNDGNDIKDDKPVGYIFDAYKNGGVRMRQVNKVDEVISEWKASDKTEAKRVRRLKRKRPVFAESYEKSHKAGDLNVKLFQKYEIDDSDDSKDILRIDSQVKFGALVRGDADIYLRFVSFNICIWDVLPGYLLLTESGGRVTDKYGNPIDFLQGRYINGSSLIATAAGFDEEHEEILATIAQYEKTNQ